MKITLVLILTVMLSVSLYCQTPFAPTPATNNFKASVYCTHTLLPDGSTCNLGPIYADGSTYITPRPGFQNSLTFTLEGQDPTTFAATYTVTNSVMTLAAPGSGGPVTINTHWVVNDAIRTNIAFGNNVMINLNDVTLIPGTHPCGATATFTIFVDDITALPSALPQTVTFNMTLTADLNNM